MHVVKTALRESFDNIHVGFLYSSKDETIKIETDRGKIGGEKMLLIFIYLTAVSYPQYFIILAMYGSGHFSYFIAY